MTSIKYRHAGSAIDTHKGILLIPGGSANGGSLTPLQGNIRKIIVDAATHLPLVLNIYNMTRTDGGSSSIGSIGVDAGNVSSDRLDGKSPMAAAISGINLPDALTNASCLAELPMNIYDLNGPVRAPITYDINLNCPNGMVLWVENRSGYALSGTCDIVVNVDFS